MKKLFLMVTLFASIKSFASSLPDLTKAWQNLARYPVLVHFVQEADKARKPEIKSYIGINLFGNEWEAQHLSVAQEVVNQNMNRGVPAAAETVVIVQIMQKASEEGRVDVVEFMGRHQRPGRL